MNDGRTDKLNHLFNHLHTHTQTHLSSRVEICFAPKEGEEGGEELVDAAVVLLGHGQQHPVKAVFVRRHRSRVWIIYGDFQFV